MMDDTAVVTKEQIITELQQLAQEQGRVPRRSLYNHFEKARQLFGSWPDALKAAGLENEQKRFYKQDFFDCRGKANFGAVGASAD